MRIAVGVDFAISKKDKANRTSLTVAGQTAENVLQFIGQTVGRWDTPEIIEALFTAQELWNPDCFFVEDGVIWKAVEPILNRDMALRGVFLNCVPVSAMKDKATKGRSWQKRMKAGACRFDKEADWYAEYEHECLRFTGHSEAVLDDQFDSSAIVSRGFDSLALQTEDDFLDEDEMYSRGHGPDRGGSNGRSTTTGY
jgi:hypothetical protein